MFPTIWACLQHVIQRLSIFFRSQHQNNRAKVKCHSTSTRSRNSHPFSQCRYFTFDFPYSNFYLYDADEKSPNEIQCKIDTRETVYKMASTELSNRDNGTINDTNIFSQLENPVSCRYEISIFILKIFVEPSSVDFIWFAEDFSSRQWKICIAW